VPLLNNFRRPLLCYVTDRRSLAEGTPSQTGEALLRSISVAAAAGVDWIQIREKDLSGEECASLVRGALQLAAEPSADRRAESRIIVNDHLDVAIAERASGVHLGENGIPAIEAKRLLQISPAAQSLREDFLVGVSCHSLGAAKSAASDGADYLFFGPVFATPSKANYGAPQGLDRLAEVCRSVSIPILAIGGITLENASLCIASGAAGIAAIRLFQDATNASSTIARLRGLSQIE
jgi:thiamine-phosphate pyrophosphorylase